MNHSGDAFSSRTHRLQPRHRKRKIGLGTLAPVPWPLFVTSLIMVGSSAEEGEKIRKAKQARELTAILTHVFLNVTTLTFPTQAVPLVAMD